MCELGLLFGHKLNHLKFEIHVVMHLSQRRLQMRCQNINSSTSMRYYAHGSYRGWETELSLVYCTLPPKHTNGFQTNPF